MFIKDKNFEIAGTFRAHFLKKERARERETEREGEIKLHKLSLMDVTKKH